MSATEIFQTQPSTPENNSTLWHETGSASGIKFSIALSPSQILTILLLACLASRLFLFVGIGINDDLGYIHNARGLADGYSILSIMNQIGFRLGMVLPLTILYKLFGYSEAAFSSFSIVSSLLTCMFLYLSALSLWGLRAAIFTALLWIAYPLQLVFDTQLSPSNQHAAVISAAFFFFIYARKKEEKREPIRYMFYFLSGACLGLGWMVNELFVIMGFIAIPMLIVFKPRMKAICVILIGLGLIFFIDFAIAKFASGSWMARIDSIVQTENVVISNKDITYLPRTLFRVFNTNPMSDEGHFGVLWYVFIVTTLWALYKKKWVPFGISMSVWMVLGYLQWGVMSVDGTPITKYIRYISMLVPFQCLAIGAFIHFLYDTSRQKIILPVFLIFLFSHLIYTGANAAGYAKTKTNDYRKIVSTISSFDNKNLPVYTDDLAAQFMELYSSAKINVIKIDEYTQTTPPIEGFVVLDGSWFVVNNIDYRNRFPGWYKTPLNRWILIRTISEIKTNSFNDTFDPKIYYIPPVPKDPSRGFF